MEILHLLSAVWNGAPDGVSILDTSFRVVEMNATMRTWYAHQAFRPGTKCFKVYHGRNRPCSRCPARLALKSKRATTGIVPYHGPKGEIQGWQKLTVFPLCEGERVIGFIEYVEDITERKHLEEEVNHLQTRVQFLEKEVGLLATLLAQEKERHRKSRQLFATHVEPLFAMLSSSLPNDFQKTLLGILRDTIAHLLEGRDYVDFPSLTPREWEVAKLLAQGLTSKEIAEVLSISKKAVDFHRGNLRKKLQGLDIRFLFPPPGFPENPLGIP